MSIRGDAGANDLLTSSLWYNDNYKNRMERQWRN